MLGENKVSIPEIKINYDIKGTNLNDLYGLFFEDINHEGDGDLYAEMIQTRSFEFNRIDNHTYHSLYAWENEDGTDLEERGIALRVLTDEDRKSTRLNSSHVAISYAVVCLKRKR